MIITSLGLLTYGLAAADAAYAALRIRSAYDERGVEGVLHQVSTEVVSVVTGAVAGRAIAGVAYKVGSKVYPTVDKALQAYFKFNPEVAKALGGFKDTLVDASRKVTQAVGGNKYVAGATQKLQQVENAIRHTEKKVVDKVKQQLGSFGDNLVEHTVPQKVLTRQQKREARRAAKESAKKAKQNMSSVASTEASVANNTVQEVTKTLSMKEIAQQKFEETKQFRDILDKQVEELSKTVSHERCGELINIDTHSAKIDKIYSWTTDFYNNMSVIDNDVQRISKNTNIPEHIIQRIKSHVFLEEHILDHGISKFAIDENMAIAWERLINNKFIKSDLTLLQHEYAELLIMNGLDVGYREAHDVVETLYDWRNSL